MTRCARCDAPLGATGAPPHTDLECAVEVVSHWLEEHGHSELARAVCVATDPAPATERDLAEQAAQLRHLLRQAALA